MGGMIAIAFTALHGDRTIAACADVAFAKPDVYRTTLFRVWRRMAEAMPWDDFSDHVTTQAVGASFLETEEGKDTFDLVRSVIGLNDPYTVRQACIAMEQMDLSPLVPKIERPLLMTNGTHDILCPPVLAPSGLGARKMAETERAHHHARVPGHRPRRPARVPGGRRAHRRRLLRRSARPCLSLEPVEARPPTESAQAAGGGWWARQWRAISARVVTQTSSQAQTWSRKRSSARARPGFPTIRQ